MSRLSLANPLPTTIYDGGSIDAFGRLRVSNPHTVFDSKQLFDDQPLFWEDKQIYGGVGATTTTHDPNKASTTIAIGAGEVANRTRQTYMRFNYQPGKSQLIFMTGTLLASGGDTGVQHGWGFGDNQNGIFLRHLSGTIALLRRSYRTGSVVTTSIQQNIWNLDKMDGTGPSGVTLDFTKSQIFVIDFEWLGVGRMRCGFVVDGAIIYCHEFNHANEGIGVYMSTPNLPLRYWIQGDGTQEASSIEHICSTVISEGGQQDLGTLRHADNSITSAMTAGTTYALLGIRLKSTHIGAVIDLINASLLCVTKDDAAHWEIRINPTVAGTFTYADATNSAVQIANGAIANTVTGGVEVDGGYFTTTAPATNSTKNALRLGSAIDGTVDEIVLCVRGISANINVHASMTWRELN